MLHELIEKHQNFDELSQALAKPNQIVHGLTAPAKSFFLSGLLETSEQPMIFITETFHDSQIYYQEIKNLSSKPVYHFQSHEISPYDLINSDISILAHQYEVFESWERGEVSLAVMPYKALLQLYINRDLFEKSRIRIDNKLEISPQDLSKKLLQLGYTHESLVDSRAQFSHRGDIFDIYPLLGDPVRIEFFGDSIESLRRFSINSQRSIQDIDSLTIHSRYLLLRAEDDGLEDRLEQEFKEQIAACGVGKKGDKKERREHLESLFEIQKHLWESQTYWEGLEYYRGLVSKPASILDFLPSNTHLVFDEWQDLFQRAQEWEEKLDEQYSSELDSGKLLDLDALLGSAANKQDLEELESDQAPLHLSMDKLAHKLNEFKQKLYLQTFSEAVDGKQDPLSYELCVYPAEKFASKIESFVNSIKTSQRNSEQVLIFSEQPQRVLGILKEWDVPAIYLDEESIHEKLNSDNGLKGLVWIKRDGTQEGFKVPGLELVVYTDRELFGRSRQAVARQKTKEKSSGDRYAYSDLSQLKAGDYVVHFKHGVGLYQGTEFIELDNFGSKQRKEYLAVEYADEARLLIPIDQIHLLSRFKLSDGAKPKLSKLGGAEWSRTKKKVKKSVKRVAQDLLKLYSVRAQQKGHKYPEDTPWQLEMEDAFPYTETGDQLKAIAELKSDMQTDKLMDRLICGDAGFGKTEVVLRAVFKTIMEGKQAAILVPTTVLAQQHFNVFSDRFASYPVRMGLLSRFKTPREQKDVVDRLNKGECDLVIGTHRLLQKDIKFKNLGLLIIDEEQRFGVSHKEKLKAIRLDLDVITMSATPIPRTLHMALAGARDISLISTPPVNRLPVKTFVGEYKSSIVKNAILHELERGGQVFFLHNRVEDIEEVAHRIRELVPEATVGVAHGQMNDRDLEDVMFSFVNHEFQVLVCTTIIETGLDIANANTIIIDRANAFGLAQLYQLRGRVGRSDVQAYAYLLYHPEKEISDTARQRLKAIRELTNLGSGYQVAIRDMEIRGVGNILGAEQHGHVLSVGFDLYCKLLNESIEELKGNPSVMDYDKETSIDLNISAYFPEAWIENKEQRMTEYKRLAEIREESKLNTLIAEWEDRFGALPQETKNLVEILRLKLLAREVKITSIVQDPEGIKIYASLRLQVWLPVQRSLSDYLQSKTTFKAGSLSSNNAQPYIYLKTSGISPEEQLEALREIIDKIGT